MRTTAPTARQQAVLNVLITAASRKTITLPYLQGAFSWRQVAAATRRRYDGYSRKLAEYVNLHADAAK